MCGIAGVVSFAGEAVREAALAAMVGRLRHRGPDDSGMRLFGPGPAGPEGGQPGAAVGLAHARLSIIDLSPRGRQPLANEAGDVWITYNGEIYNHLELRAHLQARGHCFASHTDTEVVVHAYEEWGEEVFARLNGMFALALWDARRSRLYLARDRFGQKPLYYRHVGPELVFGSEIKAILAYPGCGRRIDPRGLSQYLAYEYVPVPRTIFQEVRKLPPAACLCWDGGEARIRRYWRISFARGPDVDPEAAAACTRARLQESIRRRLMSDVPLGVFLSGGMDSSSIVALLSGSMDPRAINTFAIGFRERSFDESGYAAAVARYFGTTHHERQCTPAELLELLPEVWDFLDEPFADPSILPTYMLCKFAREHITVALGGDGGDELLAGYDPFLAQVQARWCDRLPRLFHSRWLRALAGRLPVSTGNMGFAFRLQRFLAGLPYPLPERNQVWIGSFPPREQLSLFAPDLRAELRGFDPYAIMRETAADAVDLERDHWQDCMSFLYSRFYLGEGILTKIDRASMAVSLEVRSPFLDVEFAEFANRLPPDFKLRRWTRKWILKRAMRGLLPAFVARRAKKGFGVPLTAWLRGELRPLVEDYLGAEQVARRGLLDPGAVRRVVESHYAGARDNRKRIWTLLMLEAWCRRYLDGS